jgi:hypothetical protein
MRTSELTGAALDWAVAECERLEVYFDNGAVCLVGQPFDSAYPYWNPSVNWAQGGPIIEREEIGINFVHGDWVADTVNMDDIYEQVEYGDTPLIAAMRCYVAGKLGREIDVPEELLK